MKVGFGLKLQEALRRKLEKRPDAAIDAASGSSHEPATHDEASDDDDASGNLKSLAESGAHKKPIAPVSRLLLGYRNECITVDARLNKKGQYVLAKGSVAFDPKEDPKTVRKADSLLDPYCLVITRHFNLEGRVESTILDIQSPCLVSILRDIVTYYPDNTFRIGDTIKCEDPPKLIYYHRNELSKYKDRPDTDGRTKLHLDMLLKFLYSHIGKAIDQYEKFLAAGMVKFAHLWMMFKPGSMLYHRETDQVFYLENANYAQTQCGTIYMLACQYVDFDGKKLGKAKRSLSISGFANPRELTSLPTIPLELVSNAQNVKAGLLHRAKRFLQLRGIHALQHSTKGRVMVDAETFLKRVLPGDEDSVDSEKRGLVIGDECKCRCPVCLKEVEEKPEDYDHAPRVISEDEMLLCSSTVLGFTLTSHKWLQMRLDDLSEVDWALDAINRLVLDPKQKRVLSSLIKSPVFAEGLEGDVIGWKGKGLVMLLHGAPGTGKTLTAESVCESLQRPLYIVSGGELGVSPEEVEKTLQEILELSKRWRAVILIDEADVFLEERSAHDIVRNNFVSVFLRRLEYFEGILMLTTNRVEQFDDAFISRIHLALAYPELEPWMRKEIWTNALRRLPSTSIALDLPNDLDEISQLPLNGRVISYAVRTAKAIADDDGSKLAMTHLWDVVSVQQKFNDQLRQKRTTLVKVASACN